MKARSWIAAVVMSFLLGAFTFPPWSIAKDTNGKPDSYSRFTKERLYVPQLPEQAFIGIGKRGYYLMTGSITGSDYDVFFQAIKAFERYGIKDIVLILNSPGGSAFHGFAIAELMIEYQGKGFTFEVRAYGFVASAAVLLFVTGTQGKRFVSPFATFYLHEVQMVKFFDVSSTSKQRREAEFMEHIERIYRKIVLDRSKISEEKLIDMMRRETWLTPEAALAFGFADGFTR